MTRRNQTIKTIYKTKGAGASFSILQTRARCLPALPSRLACTRRQALEAAGQLPGERAGMRFSADATGHSLLLLEPKRTAGCWKGSKVNLLALTQEWSKPRHLGKGAPPPLSMAQPSSFLGYSALCQGLLKHEPFVGTTSTHFTNEQMDTQEVHRSLKR